MFYQKHMTHHMLPHIGRDWFTDVTHVFLIRDPRQVLASYLKTRPHATAEDIGVPQESALYDEVTNRVGAAPPVIDADAFLETTRGAFARTVRRTRNSCHDADAEVACRIARQRRRLGAVLVRRRSQIHRIRTVARTRTPRFV